VAVPAVTPDTVIVNPGKSARPEKVFELDVCVTVALFFGVRDGRGCRPATHNRSDGEWGMGEAP